MDFFDWENYFEGNRNHFMDIDWKTVSLIPEEERKTITSSIQQFQKGESSEGRHLFSFAKRFPDPLYLECIRLFICEEQKHASVLGCFMDKQGIKRIQKHWVDDVFRWLRKLTGIENTLIVLLTAEIISAVYYKALMQASSSKLLQKICTQILRDEDQHISFQCYTLSKLYSGKNFFSRFWNRTWHLVLMTGTIGVVWFYHRKVLKAGAYSFSKFFQESFQIYYETDRKIKNKIAPGKESFQAL
jgi:hypothetical protein